MNHALQKIACLVVLALSFSMSLTYADDSVSKRSIQIQIDKFSNDAEELAWTAYGVSLAAFFDEAVAAKPVPDGEYIPTFEAEISAREKQLQIWREITGTQELDYPYMDAMIGVEKAGYLREYIWLFHKRSTWKEKNAPSSQSAFVEWAKSNLVNHQPKTGAVLVVSTVKSNITSKRGALKRAP